MTAYEYTAFVIPDSRAHETKQAIDAHLNEMASQGWQLDQYSAGFRTNQSMSGISTVSATHNFIWRKSEFGRDS